MLVPVIQIVLTFVVVCSFVVSNEFLEGYYYKDAEMFIYIEFIRKLKNICFL